MHIGNMIWKYFNLMERKILTRSYHGNVDLKWMENHFLCLIKFITCWTNFMDFHFVRSWVENFSYWRIADKIVVIIYKRENRTEIEINIDIRFDIYLDNFSMVSLAPQKPPVVIKFFNTSTRPANPHNLPSTEKKSNWSQFPSSLTGSCSPMNLT